jgi:hypothetical protein
MLEEANGNVPYKVYMEAKFCNDWWKFEVRSAPLRLFDGLQIRVTATTTPIT